MHWRKRVRWSRRINAWLGGNPKEMLSSRLHREQRLVRYIVDLIFLILRGEVNHCFNTYCWETRNEEKTCTQTFADSQGTQSVQPMAEALGNERRIT